MDAYEAHQAGILEAKKTIKNTFKSDLIDLANVRPDSDPRIMYAFLKRLELKLNKI